MLLAGVEGSQGVIGKGRAWAAGDFVLQLVVARLACIKGQGMNFLQHLHAIHAINKPLLEVVVCKRVGVIQPFVPVITRVARGGIARYRFALAIDEQGMRLCGCWRNNPVLAVGVQALFFPATGKYLGVAVFKRGGKVPLRGDDFAACAIHEADLALLDEAAQPFRPVIGAVVVSHGVVQKASLPVIDIPPYRQDAAVNVRGGCAGAEKFQRAFLHRLAECVIQHGRVLRGHDDFAFAACAYQIGFLVQKIVDRLLRPCGRGEQGQGQRKYGRPYAHWPGRHAKMGHGCMRAYARRCRCRAICACTCAGAVPPRVLRACRLPRRLSTSYTSLSMAG